MENLFPAALEWTQTGDVDRTTSDVSRKSPQLDSSSPGRLALSTTVDDDTHGDTRLHVRLVQPRGAVRSVAAVSYIGRIPGLEGNSYTI